MRILNVGPNNSDLSSSELAAILEEGLMQYSLTGKGDGMVIREWLPVRIGGVDDVPDLVAIDKSRPHTLVFGMIYIVDMEDAGFDIDTFDVIKDTLVINRKDLVALDSYCALQYMDVEYDTYALDPVTVMLKHMDDKCGVILNWGRNQELWPRDKVNDDEYWEEYNNEE